MSDVNIRSITYSIDIYKIKNISYQAQVEENLVKIKEGFDSENIFVRTLRLNTLAISTFPKDENIFIEEVKILSSFTESIHLRWFNIAFDLTDMTFKDQKRTMKLAFYIIRRFDNAFVNFIITNKNQINLDAAKLTAQFFIDTSKLTTNGFDNFRVGVSTNPSTNTPFFPFSYAQEDHTFSFAMEITQKFLTIARKSSNLTTLQTHINNEIGSLLSEIDRNGILLQDTTSARYTGLDASLAPYPDDNISIVDILKSLGMDDVGASGTFFYTSVLTDIIKSMLHENNIRSVGFNGVMYSLLEDHLLCEANDRKMLSINQLIGYSTMCGCGLDMVPIPGNMLVEELASIILDIAAISLKLNKPLGIRVLPIPGKDENEHTEFDMDFLTNTRVMGLKNLHSYQELGKITTYEYKPIGKRQ
jgi:uncharacterized protein (UPF0210 family)